MAKYETITDKYNQMLQQTIDEANGYTGFENGEQFNSEQEVRSFFDTDNENLFPDGYIPDYVTPSDIDNWANAVIETRQHCNF